MSDSQPTVENEESSDFSADVALTMEDTWLETAASAALESGLSIAEFVIVDPDDAGDLAQDCAHPQPPDDENSSCCSLDGVTAVTPLHSPVLCPASYASMCSLMSDSDDSLSLDLPPPSECSHSSRAFCHTPEAPVADDECTQSSNNNTVAGDTAIPPAATVAMQQLEEKVGREVDVLRGAVERQLRSTEQSVKKMTRQNQALLETLTERMGARVEAQERQMAEIEDRLHTIQREIREGVLEQRFTEMVRLEVASAMGTMGDKFETHGEKQEQVLANLEGKVCSLKHAMEDVALERRFAELMRREVGAAVRTLETSVDTRLKRHDLMQASKASGTHCGGNGEIGEKQLAEIRAAVQTLDDRMDKRLCTQAKQMERIEESLHMVLGELQDETLELKIAELLREQVQEACERVLQQVTAKVEAMVRTMQEEIQAEDDKAEREFTDRMRREVQLACEAMLRDFGDKIDSTVCRMEQEMRSRDGSVGQKLEELRGQVHAVRSSVLGHVTATAGDVGSRVQQVEKMLATELATLKDQLKKCEKDIGSVQTQLAQLREQSASRSPEVAALKDGLTKYERDTKAVQTQLAELREQCALGAVSSSPQQSQQSPAHAQPSPLNSAPPSIPPRPATLSARLAPTSNPTIVVAVHQDRCDHLVRCVVCCACACAGVCVPIVYACVLRFAVARVSNFLSFSCILLCDFVLRHACLLTSLSAYS